MRYSVGVLLSTILALLFVPTKLYASNVHLGLGAGYAQSEFVNNEDNKSSFFQGFSLQPQFSLGFYESKNLTFLVGINYSLISLENLKNNTTQNELVNISGPGASIELEFNRFKLGTEFRLLDYSMVTAGENNETLKFTSHTIPINISYKLPIKSKQFGLSIKYSHISTKLNSKTENRTDDFDYKEQTIILNFKINTNSNFWNIF